MFARVTPPLLFIAFVLLLLVTLSAPIIDAIYLFRLSLSVERSAASAAGQVQFGVFGYCITRAEVSFFGFGTDRADRCSSTRLGYSIDDTVARVLNAEDIQNAVERTTTAAFVLNPVATAIAFLAFLFSLFMIRRDHFTTGRHSTTTIKTTKVSRLASFMTTLLSTLAALLTTAAFLINIVIVAVVRNRVRDRAGDALDFNWGNAVWMTLGAMVALWIASLGALWGLCCGGKRAKQSRY
ncbi:actin cortical patch SUR7/pH-response regulator pali [Coprinopsis sp. MPI-PUGE-AT-0042]|nr:actin cortical patch SUR7/pH-response regulator pali [Coprinopsis sp. MPI-PUGE-AT-0042]